MSKIAPDDPRANHMTWVAVCGTCGGWQYLADAEDTDAGMLADIKRAATRSIERGCDFRKMRFGDIELTMCECRRKAQKETTAP